MTGLVGSGLAAGCGCVFGPRARASGAREGGEEGATHTRLTRATHAPRTRVRDARQTHTARRVQHRQTHVRAALACCESRGCGRRTPSWVGTAHLPKHTRGQRGRLEWERKTRARTRFAQAPQAHAPPGLFGREEAASLAHSLSLSHCVGVSLQGREARPVVRWRLDQTACSR